MTAEQVTGYRNTIRKDTLPRLWQNKTFVSALDTIDDLRQQLATLTQERDALAKKADTLQKVLSAPASSEH